MARMDQPGRHLQSGKERSGAVALVFVSESRSARDRLVSGSSLAHALSLNAWFFVDAEHQRVLGRIQVEADHIGRLATKLRIGAHAPTLSALKM